MRDAGLRGSSRVRLDSQRPVPQQLLEEILLKTDRQDLTAEEIWRTYILLTRVEDVFRDLKKPPY